MGLVPSGVNGSRPTLNRLSKMTYQNFRAEPVLWNAEFGNRLTREADSRSGRSRGGDPRCCSKIYAMASAGHGVIAHGVSDQILVS